MRIFLIFISLAVFAHGATTLRIAEQAMQVKHYDKAITVIDKHLANKDANSKDYATYLKALAHYLKKERQSAIDVCDQLLTEYKQSPWKRKALFLKSRALVDGKNFKAAEAIYEAEANRLFSADRKKSLAQVLIEFGDDMSRKPDDNELDVPPADFNKAIQLYQKALGMEISREVRDGVLFKMARCWQQLRNWQMAEKQYRIYLAEFDPRWAGPVGSPERFRGQLRQNPLPAGKHWQDARFHLVEVQLNQAGQQVQVVAGKRHQALVVQPNPARFLGKLQVARQNAEDLIKLLDDSRQAMRADSEWLLVRSYNLPHPSPNEFDRAVQQARSFLKDYPKHPRATDTSRLLALSYRQAGRTDDAIAAYDDFASQANFTFVPEGKQSDPDIRTGVSCKETFDAWVRDAVFAIGQLRYQQKKYDEAIAQWRKYIARFPNGAQWSSCQAGIINAQFQVGLDAVTEKNYGRARKHFEQFLKDHPLDSRARQILFTLGQIDYILAIELEEKSPAPDGEAVAAINKHYSKAVEQWERLVSKYPNTEESSLALYRIGQIQEEKIGELEQALATYQRLTWGSYAGQARQRYQALTNHELRIRTERSFRTNEDAFIEITSRNAPKLTFKQYQLNLESYFRKTHGIGGIDDLDIDLIEPDKTWELEVDGYQKYKPITQRVKIPFDKNKPGVCVIKVSEEDYEATTMVIRSDIEIITKTSRRELLVFAQNLLTGQPASGVSVIASNGKEVFGTGKTGDDGVFRKNFFDTLKDASGVGVFASSENGIASCNLGLQNLKFSEGLSERGYVYTEKPTYRPGEAVHIRAILRDVVDGSYAVPKHQEYDVRVLDPKGRMLQSTTHKLSKFGALDAAITIDPQASLGAYAVQISAKNLRDAPTFNGSFQVQRYKLEKVKLAFEFPEKVIFRGEMIKATLKASYYWGAPAAGQAIDYTLPDGRTYSERTDDNGLIQIEFDPSGFMPGRHLNFKALAKDYNVSTGNHVYLARLGFKTTVRPLQKVALAGEPVDIEVKTIDADGKPTGKELTLYVLRREVAKTDRILSAVPWIPQPGRVAGEVTVKEVKVTTDAKTGIGICQLKLAKGGLYILRASGEDRFGQIVTSTSQLTISDDEDAVKLRFFAKNTTGKVGAKLPIRLHSRLKPALALLTIEGEEIISHRILKLKPGYNSIAFTPDNKHFPNFRLSVAAIDGRSLRTSSKDFTI
ncbi:MAG: tetratricopeptide repeat protein, partial [Verrucomicrobiae bacterium]|nr:tetratricopeptide repeat protein [Verrucomicrobiae bacterium]NNJ87670.1 tetratricopeptide repeat protein [Akkermansiaceae bacterium]